MIHILIPTTLERRERLAKCVASIHENAGISHIISTYENLNEGFVTPCHKLLKDLKPETYVWCIGDDTILMEPDTLKRLFLKLLAAPLGSVVQPDDGIQHGNLITMPLCTAETMLTKGIHKEFFLNFCDNIFTEIMKKENKFIYCPEVKVDHQHWVNKKAPPDATYAIAQSKFQDDQNAYYKKKIELGL